MNIFLKLLAPYIAVAICWCVFQNAWLAILTYHAQIIFWSRDQFPYLIKGWDMKLFLLMSLPCLAAGPLTYYLLPSMTSADLTSGWLTTFGLNGASLLIMVPYFGIIHPFLEQAHWRPLRKKGALAHAAFAGYHALVLHALLTPAWGGLCLVILFVASASWSYAESKIKTGILVPVLGHIIADLGIISAVYLLTT